MQVCIIKEFKGLLLLPWLGFSIFSVGNVRAAHLMGGDLTYKYVGNNRYALQFLIYRDASCTACASMPSSITYYVYAGSYVAKGDYSVYTTHTTPAPVTSIVKPVAPNCSAPAGVSVQQGVFRDTFTAGTDSVGYHITWYSNGYRNNSIIVNLQGPPCSGNTGQPYGMLWYTFIPANKYANSSPQFLDNPIPYLCVGQTNTVLPTASDPNNDSLVYSLQIPFSPSCSANLTPYPYGHPTFQQVTYASGYSPSDPFRVGKKSISIDPQTGVITANPTKTGAYVIAIQVDEYRYDPVRKKTVHLDFVRRDLEFLVGSGCPPSSPPSFTSTPSGSKLVVAPGDSLVFDVEGVSANGSDSVHLSATSGIFSGSLATITAPYATFTANPILDGPGKVQGHFVWKPSCRQITYSSPITVTFNLSDQSCHTVYYTIEVEVQPRPILTPPLLKCANIIGSSSIQLSLIDSSTKPEFLQYKIYRDTNYSGHFQLIDSVSSLTKTSYTDTKATNNKKTVYSYYITSQNNCGLEGLPSDTVSSLVLTLKKIGDKRVNITWNPASSHVKSNYEVYQGSLTSISPVASISPGNRFYSFASCSGTYRFRVQVTDSTGTCTEQSGDTVSVALGDITPPDMGAVMKSVSVSGFSNNLVRLTFNWSDSNDTKYYKIFRSVNGASYIQIDSIKNKGKSTYYYIDNHSVDAVKNTYCYMVKAEDSCGNISIASNSVCAPHLSGIAGQMKNTISWTNAPPVWQLFRYDGVNYTPLNVPAGSSTFIDSSVECSKTYRYIIIGSSGLIAGGDTISSDLLSLTPFDTIKPPEPKIYYTTVSKNHTVYLTWNKSVPKVKEYVVYRNSVAIDTVKKDTFFADNLNVKPQSNSYCYEVAAIDSCGNNLSLVSSPHCTIYLSATAQGCSQKIFLQWTTYSGWINGVSKYELYRKTDKSSPVLIDSAAANVDTFTDLKVNNKHKYTYYLKAYQKGGSFTSFSDSSVNSPFKPPTPYINYASKITTSSTVGQVVIRWKSQATPHIKFSRLYYKPYSAGSFSLLKDNIPVSVDSFVQTALNTSGNDYEYFMISYDSCGNVSDTSSVTKTMDLQISIGQLVHNLAWTPYQGWPVKEYYMQMLQKGVFVTVDSISGADTSKIRFPAPCNFDIYYRILAKSYLGDIAMSDTAGARAIDTIPSNPPKILYASVLNSDSIGLVFNGADSADTYGYGVFRSDSSKPYQSVGFIPYSGPGQTLYGVDPVNTTTSRHCYYITTMDSCLNTTYSDTFCTIFLSGTALNRAAQLNFTPFRGFAISSYDLETWVNNGWQVLTVKKPGDTSYFDAPLACYQSRYYRVVGNPSSVANPVTYSDSIYVLPFDTVVPPAPTVYLVTAMPGKGYNLDWHWDKKSVIKYFEIWRADSTGKYKLIDTVIRDSVFTDHVSAVNSVYKYYVIAIDSCNPVLRSTPSIVQHTMKLSVNNDACRPQVMLSWTAYQGFAAGTKSYKIYRSAYGSPQILIATVNAPLTSFTDTNVVDSSRYNYQLVAVDSSGNYTSKSDTISGVPFVYTVPKPVQIKRATVLKSAANGEILIEWNYLDRADPYAKGYRLYESNNAGGSFTLIDDQPDKNITSFVQKNINTLSGSFYYYIAPYNICNKEGMPSVIHHSVNMQINNKNLDAEISWNKYQGMKVAYYEIYKSLAGAALSPTFILPATDSFYTDTNIYCFNSYTYQVYAVDTTDSLISVSDSLTIKAFDNIAPTPASLRSASVTATDVSNGQVLINFNTSSDKNLKGYIIYRSVNNNPYLAIDTFLYTGTGTYQYFDNGLNTVQDSESYFFRSFDSCGNIALPSNTHTVMHLVSTPLNEVNLLSWNAYKGFPGTDYVIYRKAGNSGWNKIALVNGNATTYYDSNVYCHILYTYRILAQNTLSVFDSAYSNIDTARAFKITPPAPPQIINATVTVTSNTLGQIQLNWKPSVSFDVEKYIIYRRNNGMPWQQIITFPPGVNTYTDINLDTHYEPYYYKIKAIDSCGNISPDAASIFHRTVDLIATPANQMINLNWNTYWGFPANRYDLYKNGILLRSFDSTVTSFTDSFVMCPFVDNYIIKAVGQDTISWSNRDSAAPNDTTPPLPPIIKTVTVSIPNSTVDISWQPSISADELGFRIYRSAGEGGVILIQQSNSTDSSYQDEINLTGDPVCYEVVSIDHCGNSSNPSNKGCVINLNGNVKSLEHDLNWNKYELWKDSVDYYNVYRNEDNGGWIPIARVPANKVQYIDTELASFVKDFCYRVEAVEKPGGFDATSWSTVVCLNQPPIVFVPNAFTPDYSFNLNDYFGPVGNYFTEYDMKIFDRWGETVYQTTTGKPWNGTYHGGFAPMGVYMYQIVVHGYNGNTYNFQGNVEVVN